MKSSNRKRIAGMSWLIGVALLATGCATQQALDTAARTAAETAVRAAAEEAGRNNDEAKEAKIIKTRFEACKSMASGFPWQTEFALAYLYLQRAFPRLIW